MILCVLQILDTSVSCSIEQKELEDKVVLLPSKYFPDLTEKGEPSADFISFVKFANEIHLKVLFFVLKCRNFE